MTRYGNANSLEHTNVKTYHFNQEKPFPESNISKDSSLSSSPLESPESFNHPKNQLTGTFTDVPKRLKKRSRALDKLLDVAGENWNSDVDIQTNLISVNKVVDFICPSREGNFPDSESCNSYFQCDHGVALKQSCQTGLAWNMMIDQCDWRSNVNCQQNFSFNKVGNPLVADRNVLNVINVFKSNHFQNVY